MDFITDLVENLVFIFQRLTWVSVVDLTLVTLVFLGILLLLRDTQAVVLLRGVILLIVLLSLLTSLEALPAFSWLVKTTLPALVLAVPVIFAPEIRRALERLGRAGAIWTNAAGLPDIQQTIAAVVNAAVRLSDHRHGALIILQRLDNLDEYLRTGVAMNARVSPELLMQIFYPNTPLHDGAVVISGAQVLAASCVMPLSASGVLAPIAERRIGLRHRAALGISEVCDAVAVVVSEETGMITVVHGGRMIRRLDAERLENILRAFYQPPSSHKGFTGMIARLTYRSRQARDEGR